MATAGAGASNIVSPILRAKQWIEDIASLSPFYRRRSFSEYTESESKCEGASGYKSAPDHFIIGHGFTHMKNLREVCHKGFGGESYEVSSSKCQDSYSMVYGASADLNCSDNITKSDDFTGSDKCLKINVNELCPHFSDPINSTKANSSLALVPSNSYVKVDDNENTSTERIETNCRIATPVQLQLSRSNSKKDQGNPYKKHSDENLRLTELSLENNSYDLVSEELIPSLSNKSAERKTRIKIGLHYFKNKRQLRVLLQTLELTKSKRCNVFVKISLANCISKQKMVSRRISCTSAIEDLNDVLYVDLEDGRTDGKILRIRLCKESRFTRRVKLIGEANISLDELDTSFNTCLWVVLRSKQKMVRPSSFELISDSECSREEPRSPYLSRQHVNDSDFKLLLNCSRTHFQSKTVNSKTRCPEGTK